MKILEKLKRLVETDQKRHEEAKRLLEESKKLRYLVIGHNGHVDVVVKTSHLSNLPPAESTFE